MNITVRIANNYGSRVVYPVCQRAHAFADIAGTKTLTDTVLATIQTLGFGVVVEQESI
jgi:hypothetical protein